MQKDGKAQGSDSEITAKALEAISKAESVEDIFAESDLIGKALMSELKAADAKTVAKSLHVKGLIAAKKFEEFVETHFENVRGFEKTNNEYTGQIVYDLILPRVYLNCLSEPEVMHEFSEILNEAVVFDVALEKENPAMKGMIYLDIAFPTVLRVQKK